MPVKLKDVKNLIPKYGKWDDHVRGGELINDGVEWAKEQIGERQIGLNIEKLAHMVSDGQCVYGFYSKDCDCSSCYRARELSENIISAEAKIIEVKE